jgi:hypothetical protein
MLSETNNSWLCRYRFDGAGSTYPVSEDVKVHIFAHLDTQVPALPMA